MKTTTFWVTAIFGLLFSFSGAKAEKIVEILPVGGGAALRFSTQRFRTVGDLEQFFLKKENIHFELLYKEDSLGSDVVFTDLDPRESIYLWPVMWPVLI